ncbi:putative proteasome-mediated ubiquitin-dependent protein catabolic process [Trypoxylus dichotomus]
MPKENLEEEGLEKNPNLELARLKYLLTVPEHRGDEEIISKIMEHVKRDDMAPWYNLLCEDLEWEKDEALYIEMKAKNDEEIKKLDEVIEDAEKNLGEMEVRDAYLKKAEYYSRIGDRKKALSVFRKTYEKSFSLGYRLDILFHNIRIGLFFMNHHLINSNIEKAKSLIEEGGDWDRRNRLKVYQGVYCIAIRDFKTACNLFLDTVSTFTSYELMDYTTFVRYTVYLAGIALPRNQLKDKIIRGSEVMEVLHSNEDVKNYIFSLYNCQYADFFVNLASVEELMRKDYLFHPHYRYYVREMKILAYSQLLESYRSLTLAYMSEQFGVTAEYIDDELSRFIACGRLHCQIDRVGGIVETNRPDNKNAQFQAVLKQGDLLLNRVQKLSRVINI